MDKAVCIKLGMCVVGMFPAGVRLCLVQVVVQGLEVDSFDFLQGKGAVWGAAGPDAAWGAEQQCPRVLAGAHQLQACGAVKGFLGLLVTCTQDTIHCRHSVHDLNLHFICGHVCMYI